MEAAKLVRGWAKAAVLLLLLLGALIGAPNQTRADSTFSLTINSGLTGDIRLTGYAFPAANVTFLRDNVVAGTQVANSNSAFDQTFSGLTPATYTFSIYAIASDGRKTLTISFSVGAVSGQIITVSGIVLPSIVTIPSTIKRSDTLTEAGLAQNGSTVTTFTHSDSITKQTTVDSLGNWSVAITDVLGLGSHTVSAIVNNGSGGESSQTSPASFTVLMSPSLNSDGKVNLTDFSILMFNYGLSNPPNKLADINDDSKVDLVDFSIMMFYWTG